MELLILCCRLNQSNWADLILNLAEQTDKMLPQLEPIRSGQRDGRDDRGRGGYQRRGDQREGGGEGGYRGGRGGYGRATSGRIPQGSEELSRARKNQGPSRYGDKWEARGRGATRPRTSCPRLFYLHASLFSFLRVLFSW